MLVANLPYNVSVPVVLHLLATVPSLRRGLVMMQAEVADGYAQARRPDLSGAVGQDRLVRHRPPGGVVGRAVFWPVPRVQLVWWS